MERGIESRNQHLQLPGISTKQSNRDKNLGSLPRIACTKHQALEEKHPIKFYLFIIYLSSIVKLKEITS